MEIKPFHLLKEFDTGKIFTALKGTEKWGKEVLLLGFSILVPQITLQFGVGDDPVILGYLGEFERDPEPGDYNFSRAILNYYEERWGFYHEEGGWNDRMTGLYDGDHYLCTPDYEEVLEFWNKAGNIVQWKARI